MALVSEHNSQAAKCGQGIGVIGTKALFRDLKSAPEVFLGLRVLTLVEMGLDLKGVSSALNLETAIELLDRKPSRTRGRGAAA